jgi:hypothetical protein
MSRHRNKLTNTCILNKGFKALRGERELFKILCFYPPSLVVAKSAILTRKEFCIFFPAFLLPDEQAAGIRIGKIKMKSNFFI